MKVCLLGSGSSGNSVLAVGNRSAILVDAGFSGKNLVDRLHRVGFKPEDLEAILITHEHIDHIRGAGILARKYNLKLMGTEATFNAGRNILGNVDCIEFLTPGRSFNIGDLEVNPFALSHDASDPVGFTLESNNRRLGICTDTGYVTQLIRHRLKGCHALVIEMNHDSQMLMAGPYPWSLKQRIRSKRGHLSNESAGEFVSEIWHQQLRWVFVAHLSKENNVPELAYLTAQDALVRHNACNHTEVIMSSQNETTKLVDINVLEAISNDR